MRENRQPAGNPTVNRKKRAISEAGRAALGGNRRREGATVVRIVTIVDREEGAAEIIREAGYAYAPILTVRDFL